MKFRLALFALLLPVAAIAADPPLTRIGFGSCMSQEKPQPIWEAVVRRKPELFLLLGDNIYSDTDNVELMKLKYGKLAEVPEFQKLRATCPLMATWDDHDYGTDDSGVENPIKPQAQKMFLEFFQEPADSPRWKQAGIYTAKVFGPEGQRVQVIMLDTRYHRSKLKKAGKTYLPDSNPDNTFLGEDQWKWLEGQLKVPAELRLLCSSIQIVPEEHRFEKWANFPHERLRLFQLLRDTQANGVVILSGDRHLAELSVCDAGIGYPLYDLTSSGLNMASKRWKALEKNGNRVATMPFGDNFGWVQIDWDAQAPNIRLQILDVNGEVTIQQKLDLAVLKPDPRKVGGGAIAASKPVGAGAITAAEAGKKVGEKVSVEFAVKNTGAARDKSRVFLNSGEFRDKDNFTVVLDMKKLADALKTAGIANPQEHYKGKTIRVAGTVSSFRDSPQIVVEDLQQIEIVGK